MSRAIKLVSIVAALGFIPTISLAEDNPPIIRGTAPHLARVILAEDNTPIIRGKPMLTSSSHPARVTLAEGDTPVIRGAGKGRLV